MNQNQLFEAERALIPVTTIGGQLAMSSRDIATETGKRHDHVLRDIEKMFAELEINAPRFGGVYTDAKNRERKEYLLNKELTLTLISGYSAKLRSAIINRWQELEETSKFKLPTHLETTKHLVLALQVMEDTPKVEFYEQVTASDTVWQLAVAAQVAKLPFGRNNLFKKLRKKGVLMSGGQRHNLPKQRFIGQGLFTLEESSYQIPKTKQTEVNFTIYVTQKGIDWLIRNYRTPIPSNVTAGETK